MSREWNAALYDQHHRFVADLARDMVSELAPSNGELVLDLGRPTRFLNMLRVFKPTSPMSVGAWILSGFGGAAALALASALFHLGPVLFWLGAGPAAVLGGLLATYTGVLIGVTTVPAWAAHDRTLPVHFGMAGDEQTIGRNRVAWLQ